ncbi:Tyrosine decarboxylase 1, partial [Dichanthelium oligosanthes]
LPRDGSGSSNGANGGGERLRPMDAEQLRECGHRMVDFVADYYKSIETFPVLSQVQARTPPLSCSLNINCPQLRDSLSPLDEYLSTCMSLGLHILPRQDIREKIVPGVTHWQSPNYFAYYPSNSSTAGFLGEMLSAAFNIVGFSWITSPAATELEVIVLDWFAKMLNLPSQFLSSALGGGVIQGTASEAVLVVLLAARDRTLRKHGKTSLEKLVVYASDQTHSALEKACQVGTTSSSAVDPLLELGQIAKDRSYLIQSLSTNPEFLKNKASQANSVLDFKDWQIPLGRRFRSFCFRSLKLWMVLRLYGVDNLQSYIRKHIELAKYFEQLVISDSRFEVVTPRNFSLVCFRLLPLASDQDNGRKLNYDLMDAANSSGKIFISHTVLSGKFVLRFAVGAPLTEEQHVFAAWKLLQDLATKQLGNS